MEDNSLTGSDGTTAASSSDTPSPILAKRLKPSSSPPTENAHATTNGNASHHDDEDVNPVSSFNCDDAHMETSSSDSSYSSSPNLHAYFQQMLANAAPEVRQYIIEEYAGLFRKPRAKLTDVNTIDDVVQLIASCKKIMVVTGAGISVSSGIPDFRSRDGLYARLKVDFPELPTPQSMFDIQYFLQEPRPFFKFAKEIYPGNFTPTTAHYFIKTLDSLGTLLCNYSQNIDCLENVADIQNLIQCHGSFKSSHCVRCKTAADNDHVKQLIFAQEVPICHECPGTNDIVPYIKPDIVFFGESLPDKFHAAIREHVDQCDLLIVMGSSLNVAPVSRIPSMVPDHVPAVLINRQLLHNHVFDVELLGDADVIVTELARRLRLANVDGWDSLAPDTSPPSEVRVNNRLVEAARLAADDDEEDNDTWQAAIRNEGGVFMFPEVITGGEDDAPSPLVQSPPHRQVTVSEPGDEHILAEYGHLKVVPPDTDTTYYVVPNTYVFHGAELVWAELGVGTVAEDSEGSSTGGDSSQGAAGGTEDSREEGGHSSGQGGPSGSNLTDTNTEGKESTPIMENDDPANNVQNGPTE